MRIAVIGLGKMGMLHAGIMNSLKDVKLCAACDNSHFLLNAIKSLKKEITIYNDYIEMLEREAPDAVVIATPVFLHIPMAMECAVRKIPFLLEKPLSTKSDVTSEYLIEIVQKKKITNMVGYMMRYVDTFMKAKKILDLEILGQLITFQGTIYVSQLFNRGKGWRYKKEKSGGGVVISQASHLIDLLKWYFGTIESISAHIKNWYSTEVEDFAHIYFKFQNGLTGWIDSSWSIRHHRLMEIHIQVHGENGVLFVSDDFVKIFLDKKCKGFLSGWTQFLKPELYQGVEIDIGGTQYTKQDKAFLDAVRENKWVDSDIVNAYEVQKIVDCIYMSASKDGEPQKIFN